jgi:hypothetical protein
MKEEQSESHAWEASIRKWEFSKQKKRHNNVTGTSD